MPYQGTFLIVGGYCIAHCEDVDSAWMLDTVIRYKKIPNRYHGEWEILPMRLAMGRYDHIVIPKPAC